MSGIADRGQEPLMADFDLAIIGGGINGTGIARDAAGRGLSVLLVEQNDRVGTSSKSTKLIHGGLRYLEFYVPAGARGTDRARGADPARAAPDPAAALRAAASFRLRPAWMLRLGLFLYDHLGGREILPGTELVDLSHHAVGEPLKREFRQAFVYSDGWVDDARLVVLNAVDAAERGAVVRTRTRLTRRSCGRPLAAGAQRARPPRGRDRGRAGQCVRSLGPEVADHLLRLQSSAHVRLIKGSHIVVPRLFEHDHAYIFQNADNRIVFAIPYEGDSRADRHDRSGLQGRSRGADRERRRDQLPLRRSKRLFPQTRDAGSGAASILRRAPTL